MAEELDDLDLQTRTALAIAKARGKAQEYADIPVAEGVGRAVVQGGTFGLGDELVAGGIALRNALGNALGAPETFGSVPGKSFSDVYDASLANQRQELDAFREQMPALAYGAEIAGALPTAIGAGGMQVTRAVQGAPLLGRAAAQAGLAAGQGVAYGFNADEGGFLNRLDNAALTGLISAPMGLVGEPLTAAGRALWQRFTNSGAAQRAGMTDPVRQAILRAAEGDDALSGIGAQRINDAGPDAMLADAGDAFVGSLDAAMQASGGASNIARTNIGQRLQSATNNVNSALDQAFGQPAGVRDISRQLRQSTSGVRGDAYDAAYAQAIDYSSDAGRQLQELVEARVPAEFINDANKIMRQELGRGSQQIMAEIADDGTVTFRSMPDVQQLDYITRALREQADTMRRAGNRSGARRMSMLAGEIRGIVRQMVPEYDQALRTAADMLGKESGLEIGYDALRASTTRDLLREQIEGMTEAERTFVAQGVRSYIDDVLANTRRAVLDPDVEVREALKGIKDLSSRAAREKIEAIIGTDAAKQLFATLDESARAFELQARVARNSATFARTETAGTVRESVEGGVIPTLQRGEPVNVARRMWQSMAGGTPDDMARNLDAVNAEIARILTGPRGPQALAVLQALAVPQATPGLLGRAVSGGVGLLGNVMQRGAAPTGEMGRGLLMGN